MNKGFDCGAPLTAAKLALFAEQGFTFVGRYLAAKGSWKRLSPQEAQLITDTGLFLISFYELYANRCAEGAEAGHIDGQSALRLAKEVGQPEGSTIYFAVDYDAQPRDFNEIEAYLRAADEQITGYELGVYGSYTVVKAMYERGVATKIMQTYAWSRGLVFDYNSIYQYKNDITVNGHGIDYCSSNGDAGGWKLGMAIQQQAAPTLQVEVANNIIDSYLKKSWDHWDQERVKAEAEGRVDEAAAWKQLRDWQHTLANSLRLASGQAEVQ